MTGSSLAPASVLLSFLLALPAATSAAPRVIGNLDISLTGATPEIRALSFVERYRKTLMPGDTDSNIVVKRVVETSYGRVVQMDQLLLGHKVFGRSLSIAEDNLKKARLVVNGLRSTADLARHSELCPEKTATSAALAAFTSAGGTTRATPSVETAWMAAGDDLVLMRLVTVRGLEPLGEFTYLVGPMGEVIFVFNRSPMAAGYAYESNPVNDTYKQVDLPYLTSTEHLTGDNVTVYNCSGSQNCGTKEQLAAPDLNGDYLIEPTGDDDPALLTDKFVEVQAYYGINTIHDYFVGVGFNPTPIEVQVNFPMSSPNAYYDQQSNSIVMGQSSYLDTAVENDIIFHEYGHHVFGQVSQTGMFNMDEYGPVFWGLAFNEGTADYYSCSALDDPELAEYFAQTMGAAYFPNGWMRNVDNELTCPDGLYGEAHDDSMVWTGFLWKVRALIGQAQADKIYMDVIAAFPADIDFPSATQVYMDTAALTLDQATMNQVQALADERGMGDCERFIRLSTGGHTGYLFGKEVLGSMGNSLAFVPAELHYFVELPDNATHLKIDFSSRPTTADIVFLVRKDQKIQHQLTSYYPLQITSNYDFLLENDIDIDLPSADPLFEPGHTYYLQPVDRGQATGEYTISGEVVTTATDGGTDGGTADGGADGGGDIGADGGGPPDCGEGFDAAWDGEKWVCVPLCKDGYEPKLEDGGWICAPKNSGGCGCGEPGSSPAPWVTLAVLFAALVICKRRKRA